MASKRRHHRKIKQNRVSVPTSTVELKAVESDARSGSAISYIKHDLLLTTITVAVLAALLILAYYLNLRYGWTLKFGSLLYQLLHIR